MSAALFVAAYAAGAALLLPGTLFTLAAGWLWGPWWGLLWASTGATAGAGLSFLISRHLARPWVERRLGADPRWQALREASERDGWKIVLLARLSPLLPYNMLNYALGLTRVPLPSYLLASWLGMLPGAFLYVQLGWGAGLPKARWGVFAAGLAATAALLLYAARISRRALERRLNPRNPP